ncbi:response regulator transcription factor [Nocardia alba]|uniref:LuxR family two component transcriptional regulator n=1 Tax=Nocardia alba TaxID=225051 RepID=A0A4R1FDK3_9NOCA|nr:response regulator transcription factor [Nocardia alba]TCJ89898.1 LuxR family two component transcriptional regulator [Nocardia alba]
MIRVLLVEDADLIRTALSSLLRAEVDIDVVGEVARGDEALDEVRRLAPDVAVIDIDLPGLDGIEVARQIMADMPAVRVLMLTTHARPQVIRRALAQRVQGFMLKGARAEALADGIRTVAAGGRSVDSELALSALEATNCPLTGREVEVLRVASQGTGTREIAQSLALSPGTVRNYLASTVSKLHARNRIDAIRIAAESGWL